MKKGQASTEYIIVLAIAVVLVMVGVGIALGYIKLSKGSTYDDRSFIYWQNTQIAIKDYEIRNASGPSVFVFQNNNMYRIMLRNITFVDYNTQVLSVNRPMIPGSQLKVESNDIRCRNGSAYGFKVSFLFDNRDDGLLDKGFTGYEKLTGPCKP